VSLPSVAHLVPARFGPNGVVGGAERYVFELARHMARHTDTRLVTFGERDEDVEMDGLRVTVAATRWLVRGQRANPMAWRAISAVSRADVVHCHQQHILATSLAALAGRVRGRRVFCTDLGGGGWDISGYVSTDRLFHGHLHISRYSRHVFGHDGLATARVIYGGVDADRFSPGSEPRDIPVLYVGRLLPHKGVDAVIEALPAGVEAVVAGPAADARFVEDLKRLSSGKSVRFVHDADDAQLIALYRRARIVILPSVYRDRYGNDTRVPELLGQTLLEGMAAGAATICTDVASMPEIVQHGVTGLVVPPNDIPALGAAIAQLAGDAVRTAEMGRLGRERACSTFSWSAVVDRCLEAYAA
jgi:glycosyltransferase involved in cell wall biosynthesis